jgi:cysteinyl-tRNA synthetase
MRAALEDDLNTAQAQAAIFEMVRQANTALDNGALKKDDTAALLDALKNFDEVFAVLEDDDVPKMKRVLQWAQAEGREDDITDSLREALQSGQLSDSDIVSKINDMKAARAARDFKKSDAVRAELTEAGVLIEITKDGIRWRRK